MSQQTPNPYELLRLYNNTIGSPSSSNTSTENLVLKYLDTVLQQNKLLLEKSTNSKVDAYKREIYLSISSAERDSQSTSSSDFILTLNKPVEWVRHIQLCGVYMLNTFYTIITGYNDTFRFHDGTANRTSTLTAGIYTSATLITHINSTATTSSGVITFNSTYSTTTLKSTLSATGNFSIDWTYNTGSTNLAKMLGYNSSSTFSGASTYTATSVINILPFPVVYISTSLASVGTTALTGLNNGVNFTFSLPVNGNSGDQIFCDSGIYKQKFTLPRTETLQQITVKLYGEKGHPINLNGSDWHLLIKITE
jgi:hypothetical protein